MKKVLVLALLMSTSLMAKENVVLEESRVFDVKVNQKTVVCSRFGYGIEQLIVKINELHKWTLLDHRDTSFGKKNGAPILIAGRCDKIWDSAGQEAIGVDDVIQGTPRIESVVIKRTVSEVTEFVESNPFGHLEEENKIICERSIKEKLETVIGGVEFIHTVKEPGYRVSDFFCNN